MPHTDRIPSQQHRYVASAQPIDEHGSPGFDEPPADAPGGVIEAVSDESLKNVLITLADRLDDPDLSRFDCWDVTLTIRQDGGN